MITNFVLILTALYIYEREAIPRLFKTRLDFKPINCVFCLSYWIGLIFAFFQMELLYLSIPLIYRIIQVKLLK
jgi:hypothetical protein